MKIYSWNVNGIRAIQKKGFLEWIAEEQPYVLCLQETKADVDQLDEKLLKIDGYYSYFNTAERKGYSGVALYTKQEPLSVTKGLGNVKYDTEGRVLIADYGTFILLNIYFPNGQKDKERLKYKMEFYDVVLDYCNQLKAAGRKIVISGDYNTAHNEIDLKHPKQNSERSGFLRIERDWLDKLVENGYCDTFRTLYPDTVKYSWWSYRFNARKNNAGWRIDYHFVSDNFIDQVKEAEIMNDVMGSDHCPVVVELDV